MSTQDQLIEHMLSGAEFTYGGVVALRHQMDGVDQDRDRLVDRTIQKLRRAGKIAWTREGRTVVWRKTNV